MFVQAKQVPVDAQLGACGVQELTSLYLAWIIHENIYRNGLVLMAAFAGPRAYSGCQNRFWSRFSGPKG